MNPPNRRPFKPTLIVLLAALPAIFTVQWETVTAMDKLSDFRSDVDTRLSERDPGEFLEDLDTGLTRNVVTLTLEDALARELRVRSKTLNEEDTSRTAEALAKEARALGFDPLMFLAVIYVESYFDHTAVSIVGAEGLMQLMPPTAAWVAEREDLSYVDGHSFDPVVNITLGSRYLSHLVRQYQGRIDHALTAYNRGPRNTSIILSRYGALPDHVYDFYAGKVLDRYQYYKAKYGHLLYA